MISLYNATETDFNHNGLVVLSDCKAVFIDEELNGKYELELEYPIDSRGKWQYLIEGNIIKASGQLFRIYSKQKTLAGIKVNARHIFYDLLDNFVEILNIGSLNAAGALNSILSNTQYEHGFSSMSDIDSTDSYTILRQNPVEAILGEKGIVSKYGGELVRDNYTIRLLQERGTDRGVLVSYGKNVIGIEETLNMTGVVTRLMPIGKNGRLLPEKYLDSPLIGNYPHPIVKAIEFWDLETEEALRTAGQNYLIQNDKPLGNYVIDFIELTKTSEYKDYAILETVYMGDTVTVRHSKLGVDLKCKVIRIKKNELTGRIKEVELGSFRANFSDTFSSLHSSITTIGNRQIQDKTDLQFAIDNATLQINSALGGYVVKRNGELLIMDTEDINTATKVWRWNQGGLGYSGTGYNGPFRTAITADGHIVANFVDTGELTASIVKTGTLTSKTGKLSIGLDNEVLNIGGEIIYNGATGEVTFGPSVVLTWANLPEDVANVNNLPEGGGGLDEAQVTTISRHEIATARIKVDQLTANDVQNPLIRLFNSGVLAADGKPTDGNPALDATFNMNQGIGHAVRFKWNDQNYILVQTDEVNFYFSTGTSEIRPNIQPTGFFMGSKNILTPATNVTISFNAAGFVALQDGISNIWTWLKDGSGRITQLTDQTGRTITVNY
jgi:phage minor structural protein